MAGLSAEKLLNRRTAEDTDLQDIIDSEDEIRESDLRKPLIVGGGNSGLGSKASTPSESPAPSTQPPTSPHVPPPSGTVRKKLKGTGGKTVPRNTPVSTTTEPQPPEAVEAVSASSSSLFRGKEMKFEIVDSIPDLLIFTGDSKVLGYAVYVQDRWLVKAPEKAVDRIVQMTTMASLTKGDQAEWPGKLVTLQAVPSGSKPIKK